MPPTDDSTKKLKKETLPGLAVGLLSGRVQVSACQGQRSKCLYGTFTSCVSYLRYDTFDILGYSSCGKIQFF